MPNYQEAPLSGARWRRSHFVSIENPLVGEKAVTFHEQIVKQLSDGEMSAVDVGALRQPFNDPSVTFPLRSPVDDTLIPGRSMTYQDVYVALHSLDLFLASKRDGVQLP